MRSLDSQGTAVAWSGNVGMINICLAFFERSSIMDPNYKSVNLFHHVYMCF